MKTYDLFCSAKNCFFILGLGHRLTVSVSDLSNLIFSITICISIVNGSHALVFYTLLILYGSSCQFFSIGRMSIQNLVNINSSRFQDYPDAMLLALLASIRTLNSTCSNKFIIKSCGSCYAFANTIKNSCVSIVSINIIKLDALPNIPEVIYLIEYF
jgi:hypothetical protein